MRRCFCSACTGSVRWALATWSPWRRWRGPSVGAGTSARRSGNYNPSHVARGQREEGGEVTKTPYLDLTRGHFADDPKGKWSCPISQQLRKVRFPPGDKTREPTKLECGLLGALL